MGFFVETSTYAFTVRPCYDEKGRLQLPDTFYDNLDYETVSNGIFVEAFATVPQLLDQLRREGRRDVALFGCGTCGRDAAAILEQENIPFQLVDNNPGLIGTRIGRHAIAPASRYFLRGKRCVCVLSVSKQHIPSMLKQINDSGCDAVVCWCQNISYKNYLGTA